MGYIVKEGKIYQQLVGYYGRIDLWYVGPAPPKTIYSFSLSIMSRYERQKNTDNRNYRYAQRVASCKLVDQQTWSDFLRK